MTHNESFYAHQLDLFDPKPYSRFLVKCVNCGEQDEVSRDDYYDSNSFYVCQGCRMVKCEGCQEQTDLIVDGLCVDCAEVKADFISQLSEMRQSRLPDDCKGGYHEELFRQPDKAGD